MLCGKIPSLDTLARLYNINLWWSVHFKAILCESFVIYFSLFLRSLRLPGIHALCFHVCNTWTVVCLVSQDEVKDSFRLTRALNLDSALFRSFFPTPAGQSCTATVSLRSSCWRVPRARSPCWTSCRVCTAAWPQTPGATATPSSTASTQLSGRSRRRSSGWSLTFGEKENTIE